MILLKIIDDEVDRRWILGFHSRRRWSVESTCAFRARDLGGKKGYTCADPTNILFKAYFTTMNSNFR